MKEKTAEVKEVKTKTNLTSDDVTNIIYFLKKASLNGEESMAHAMLLSKLAKMLNEAS